LIQNKTWDLVPFPKGKKPVLCKWIYRIKLVANGLIDKFKSWLMAKGLSHVHGVDNTESFSPIAKINSIRAILSIVATQGWVVH